MLPGLEAATSLGVAGLVGLAVGIEREWSGHATGPGARFAGVRTFLLLGLLGGVAGLLTRHGQPAIGLVLLAAGATLTVTAYAVTARRDVPEAVDGTTEAAALVVLALATSAGLGHLRVAAGVAALVVLALREKSTIQRFVRRIGGIELRAAFQFAVLALVLLPLLPEGPFGPLGGVRPRELWVVVLLVSGLNFLGMLAQRMVGRTRGSALAGALGGLVSSTAVSLAFSRESREPDAAPTPLALGVIGACTMLLPRLFVLTLVLEPALAPRLVPYFVPPLLVGVAFLARGLRSSPDGDHRQERLTRSPLRLGSAILMAVGFQATLMIMALAQGRFGASGVLASAAFLGLTDMDALTYSMTRLAAAPDLTGTAALAMAIGVVANTTLKLALVLVLGAGAYRRHAGLGLLAMGLASGVGIWLGVR
ncbi:MAG TPA: DUF4010 domain-containing protein [Gemmatimonadales bacterium]|nr:DUF4010 domain-containing protein [Gemmatimonadales bacterium]